MRIHDRCHPWSSQHCSHGQHRFAALECSNTTSSFQVYFQATFVPSTSVPVHSSPVYFSATGGHFSTHRSIVSLSSQHVHPPQYQYTDTTSTAKLRSTSTRYMSRLRRLYFTNRDRLSSTSRARCAPENSVSLTCTILSTRSQGRRLLQLLIINVTCCLLQFFACWISYNFCTILMYVASCTFVTCKYDNYCCIHAYYLTLRNMSNLTNVMRFVIERINLPNHVHPLVPTVGTAEFDFIQRESLP